MTDVKYRDLIGLFVQHRVAANLLMLIFILAGIVALSRLNTQFFPNFGIDVVSVNTVWPGASAEDVERSITRRLEQQLRSLDYVDEMNSKSYLGTSVLLLEFEEGSDMGAALDQVKQQVSQVRNLPQKAEAPEISLVARYDSIARVVMTTEGRLEDLRHLAHQAERELLERGISKVSVSGLPEEELAIQLSSQKLLSLGLDIDAVANRITSFSRDLPAGEIGDGDSNRLLRALEQRRTVESFANIPLKTDAAGQLILLDDVADIERRAKSDQAQLFYENKPAVEFFLQRTESADALNSAEILDAWLEEARVKLPKGINLYVYDTSWKLIKERMQLLISNGLSGLVLVIAILFLFLHGRVAFWVAIGIPVSFMATLFVMHLFGGSINMISMFALIMALGIIVDDAIVVGEDSLAHYRMGEDPRMAAEGGARRMLAPVIASSLTTIASFLPLILIGGIMGTILFDIPFVVICVIVASLLECFFILPGHLHHAFKQINGNSVSPWRQSLDNKFDYFRDHCFRPLVHKAVIYRSVTLSIAVGLLLISIGLIAGGRLLLTFFPSPEGAIIYANVRFIEGTQSNRVAAFLADLNRALDETDSALGGELIKFDITRLGISSGSKVGESAERYGSLQVELISPDARDVRNKQFIREWKKRIQIPPGVESFIISESKAGPPGKDIDIRLSGAEARVLKQAGQEIVTVLKAIPGVSAVQDDLPFGQQQLIYHLNGQGEVLGLTVEELGRQMRSAFDGRLVQSFQNGFDEVEVRVMLSDEERYTLATLENFMVRLPEGGQVPLSSVVDFTAQQGFNILKRSNGELAVHVTASVDSQRNNANEILASLENNLLADISQRYGINYKIEGLAENQAETIGEMIQGLVIALILIYLILTWVFSSYGWPLIVMAAIPFGLIGALLGHYAMGIDLTLLSLFGIFGLSGIVVNDSIILVSFFKQLRERGIEVTEAITTAACQRLRAVLLTSLTTIAGLTPLLFETSIQAQFLIPMAVSISFGLMFATLLVLFVIPALLSLYESGIVVLKDKLTITTSSPR